MKTVKNIRDETFHYCLDDAEEKYAKAIDIKLKRKERYIKIKQERSFPDRFEPADELFYTMFITQILGIDTKDSDRADEQVCAPENKCFPALSRNKFFLNLLPGNSLIPLIHSFVV